VGLSKADGRQRAYVLSAKGKRLLESLRREREQAIEQIWLPLDRDQLQGFATFANQLTLRLEHYGSNPKDM
jgi:DNA-binding MarR family transcriptional regulator